MNAQIDLDPNDLNEKHLIQMRVLKLGLVVTGTIRDGRTERLAPPAGEGQGGSPQVPGSFFERGMVTAEEAAPLYGDGGGQQPETRVQGPSAASRAASDRSSEAEENEGPLEVKVGKMAKR
jgi:hypothetical protein